MSTTREGARARWLAISGGATALVALVAAVTWAGDVGTEPEDPGAGRFEGSRPVDAHGTGEPSDRARAAAPDQLLDAGDRGLDTPCARVRVHDRSGRSVRSEIQVGIHRGDGWARAPSVLTEGDGRVEICATRESQLALRAHARTGEAGARLLLRGEWEDREVSLPVTDVALVRGRVTDPEGEPVHGAPIAVGEYSPHGDGRPSYLVRDAARLWARRSARTDHDGRFEVHLIGQHIYQVGARTEDFALTWAGPFAGRPGAVYETQIRLQPAVALEVTIAHDGVPLRGARLRVQPTRLHGRFPAFDLPEGRYRRAGQHPDARFRLHASADGYVSRGLTDVAVGEHTIDLAEAATVRVDVSVDPALAPCFGASPFRPRPAGYLQTTGFHGRLEGEAHTATAGLDATSGTLVFEGVPPGPARLWIGAAGATDEREIAVRLPAVRASPARLALGPDTGVIRIVADAENTDYSIFDNEGVLLHGSAASAPWVCHPLPPGTYRVRSRDEALVTVTAGRVVDVEVEPTAETPERVILGTCGPPFEVEPREDGLLDVISLEPEADGRVLPGDRIVDADGEGNLLGRLFGEPRSRVRALVERPDGTRAWINLERTPCHDAR